MRAESTPHCLPGLMPWLVVVFSLATLVVTVTLVLLAFAAGETAATIPVAVPEPAQTAPFRWA
jgi:hypothetical protein